MGSWGENFPPGGFGFSGRLDGQNLVLAKTEPGIVDLIRRHLSKAIFHVSAHVFRSQRMVTARLVEDWELRLKWYISFAVFLKVTILRCEVGLWNLSEKAFKDLRGRR